MNSSNPVLVSRGFKRQGGRKTAAGRRPADAVVVRQGICDRSDGDCGGRPGSMPLPGLVADLMTRRQAWAAALGLTLTLVWLYVEIVLSISFVPAEDV